MKETMLSNSISEQSFMMTVKKFFVTHSAQVRSLLKAISYRILGSLATILISFMLTQEINLSLSIGALDLFGKIGLYYLHERIWDRIF